MSTYGTFNQAIAFAVGVMLMVLVAGCSQNDQRDAVDHFTKPTKITIEVHVVDPLRRAQKSNSEARVVVEEMTPENVEIKKPVVLEKIDQTAQAQEEAIKGAGEATKSAVKDEKQNAALVKENKELKEKDPVITWLKWIGGGLMLAGLIAVIVGVVKSWTTWAELGAVALLTGIAATILAAILPTLIFIALWGAIIGGFVLAGWFAWRWYRTYKAGESVVDSVDVAIEKGLIPMTDELKKTWNEWQSKAAKALVDSAQQKPKGASHAKTAT